MTRWKIRYSIFNGPHDSDEIFTKYADAEEFLLSHADPTTDAVISWPDTDDEDF